MYVILGIGAGSVFGLERLGRWGHGLVSSCRLVETGTEHCRLVETGTEHGTPWYNATCFLVLKVKLYVFMSFQLKKTVLPPTQDIDIF